MYALTSTLALTAAAVFSTSAVSATTQQLPKRGVSVLATSVSNSVPVTNYLTSAGVGHCGVQNADSDLVAALAYAQFDMSYCGKAVVITTTDGVSATGAVEDSCSPSYGTCHDGNGIDTSNGLFEALGGSVTAGGHMDVTYTIYDVDYYPGIEVGDATALATGGGTANTAAASTQPAAAETNTWEAQQPASSAAAAAPASSAAATDNNDGIAGAIPNVGGNFAEVASASDEDDSQTGAAASASTAAAVDTTTQEAAPAQASSQAAVAAPAADAAAATTEASSGHASTGSDGCEGGAIQCGSDGKSFSMCSNGSWIDMGAVADDTLCSNGKVGWDPSAPGAGTSQSAAAAARMVRRTVKHRRAAH